MPLQSGIQSSVYPTVHHALLLHTSLAVDATALGASRKYFSAAAQGQSIQTTEQGEPSGTTPAAVYTTCLLIIMG